MEFSASIHLVFAVEFLASIHLVFTVEFTVLASYIGQVGFTVPHGEISRVYLVELTAVFSTLVTVPRGGIHRESQRNSLSSMVNSTARRRENHHEDG